MTYDKLILANQLMMMRALEKLTTDKMVKAHLGVCISRTRATVLHIDREMMLADTKAQKVADIVCRKPYIRKDVVAALDKVLSPR